MPRRFRPSRRTRTVAGLRMTDREFPGAARDRRLPARSAEARDRTARRATSPRARRTRRRADRGVQPPRHPFAERGTTRRRLQPVERPRANRTGAHPRRARQHDRPRLDRRPRGLVPVHHRGRTHRAAGRRPARCARAATRRLHRHRRCACPSGGCRCACSATAATARA